MEKKIYSVDGVIEANVSYDEFYEKFIKFVESNGWNFLGMTDDVTDDVTDKSLGDL